MLAIFKRWLDGNPNRFNLALLKSAVEATAKLSAFVVFILVGARIFSLTFYGVNGHVWVEHLLTSLPGEQVGFLILINIFVFLLAFFLDFFEIAFIVIPLIGPAAEKIGIDLIWLGVMLGVNMQTSFMHPPFGFALFYLRSVAAREPYKDKVTGAMTDPVTTRQIYWGAVPFVVIQCIMVGLVIGFPQMVMHYKSQAPTIDPSTIEIRIPAFGTPPAPGGLNIPPPPGLTPPADLAPPQSAAPPTLPPGPPWARHTFVRPYASATERRAGTGADANGLASVTPPGACYAGPRSRCSRGTIDRAEYLSQPAKLKGVTVRGGLTYDRFGAQLRKLY